MMKNITLMMLSLTTIMNYSNKKIMTLLSMEMMMLTVMMIIMEKVSSYMMNSIILIILSIIMVTESITGMTILILSSRESDKMSSMSMHWN